MTEKIKKDAEIRMSKCIESLRHELAKLRTGRAHTGLLDHVMVDYYGSQVPISQVASVNVGDSRTLTINPWEKKLVPALEKAILASDLGLNPVTTGDIIRVPLPPLTEERRREMTRVVRNEGENARVAIRNVRRDAIQQLKNLIKEESLPRDEEKRAEDEIQKLTDRFVADVEQVMKEKEADLMEV